MKHDATAWGRLLRVAVLGIVAGCPGFSARSASQDRCFSAADPFVGIVERRAGRESSEVRERAVTAVAESCARTGWTKENTDCFIAAGSPDAFDLCNAGLTDYQRQDIVTSMDNAHF